MRKIIVTEFITLDAVIEAPGGDETSHPHGGWQTKYKAPEVGVYKTDELASVNALLLGKTTYNFFADYWPTQRDDSFAARMNELPKYVISSSQETAKWNNSHILRNMNDVADLRKTDGGDILVYGSGTLVKSLLENELVDELRLIMYPVVIGGGLSIFDDKRNLNKFSLKQSRVVTGGIMILEYEPAR